MDEEWFAPDGGLLLKKGQTVDPYKEGLPRTTRNDNPQLHLTFYHILNKAVYWRNYFKFIDSTEHDTIPGLYHRQPGRDGSQGEFEFHAAHQSHDNIEMVAVGEIMSGWSGRCEKILRHYPYINNVTPGKVNKESINTRTPSGLMAPSSWLLVRLGDDRPSNWVSIVWYCVGLLITAYWYAHYTRHSEHKRFYFKNMAIRKRIYLIKGWPRKLLAMSMEMFDTQIERKSGGIGVYFNNGYQDGHPIKNMGVKLMPGSATIKLSGKK